VDDRQPVGIHRPPGALRHEVVHDAEEAGGQEEADGVVSIPPLQHGILDARQCGIALGAEERDRKRNAVADMQHRHGDDEGQIKPIGDVDVRILPPHQSPDEHDEVHDPDDREPEVDVPFRLGVLLRLRDAHHVARGGQDDEQLVAPEQEVGERRPAEQGGARRPLHDIERCGKQSVAAEGEDRRRGVDRAQPAKGRPFEAEIENGKASCSAITTPTRNATMPQNAAASVNLRMTASL
jgi:23S rRNA (cytosine1962-C5)-methyltransferase